MESRPDLLTPCGKGGKDQISLRVRGRDGEGVWAIVVALGVLLAIGISVAATHPAVVNIGAELAVAGVYLEESGVPMPVPSEVSVGYLGQRLGAHPWALAAGWVGLTALVVMGATNLFAISRRWGPRLVTGRIGAVLHLTPDRLA